MVDHQRPVCGGAEADSGSWPPAAKAALPPTCKAVAQLGPRGSMLALKASRAAVWLANVKAAAGPRADSSRPRAARVLACSLAMMLRVAEARSMQEKAATRAATLMLPGACCAAALGSQIGRKTLRRSIHFM